MRRSILFALMVKRLPLSPEPPQRQAEQEEQQPGDEQQLPQPTASTGRQASAETVNRRRVKRQGSTDGAIVPALARNAGYALRIPLPAV